MDQTDTKPAQPNSGQANAFRWRPTADLMLPLHSAPARLSAAEFTRGFVARSARAK